MAYEQQGQRNYRGNNYQNHGGNDQYGNNDRQEQEVLFTRRIKAGKRRTYFFDVRATRGRDYFVTLTESKRRFEDGGYERHKIFLYKEDFNKFLTALTDTINFVKTDLMPDFDFDAFNHDPEEERNYNAYAAANANAIATLPEDLVNTAILEATSAAALPHNEADIDSWKA